MDYSFLRWHLGPYGRQDVHVHSAFDDDDHVLVGRGRDCDGDRASHIETTLPVPDVLRFPFGEKRGRPEVRTWERSDG